MAAPSSSSTSSTTELGRLVSELEQSRQDLHAATERVQLARKENDRLRTAAGDIRAEHARLLSDETSRRVAAEAQLGSAKAELERERRLRREAEAAAADAAGEQRRHVEFVQDARRQFEQRLTALVGQLRTREEQVHTLEYQVRDRDRERQRADALEKIVATREAALAALSAEIVGIRREHTELAGKYQGENAALQAQVQQLQHQQQQHTENMAAAALSNSNNANATPTKSGSPGGGGDGSPPPPPPPPEEDPHVQETARLVQFSREWIKDTMKDFAGLQAECDHLVQQVVDATVIFDKGSAHAGLDVTNTARTRLQRMRDLEHHHSSEQMQKLESILPSSTVIRNGLSDIKFEIERVGTTVQSAVDAVRAIRQIGDKFCSQVGLPMLQQKLDRLQEKMQPPPLPTPQYTGHQQQQQQQQQQLQIQQQQKADHARTNSGSSKDGDQQQQQQQGNKDSKDASSAGTPNVVAPPPMPVIQQQQQPPSPTAQASTYSGPVVALDEYIQIQQKLSQAEVAASTDKVRLEGEVMSLKMQVQMEKDRITAEKSKTEFESERKFAEERRALQRAIDEAEMKLHAAERAHDDELRRRELEGARAVEKTRTDLLDETRAIRDQCRSLERSEGEAAEMILQLQEQVADAKGRRKEAAHEAARLADELRKEAQVAASLTVELQTARETIVELSEELDRAREAHNDLLEHQQHSGGGGGAHDTGGLGGFAAAAAAAGGGGGGGSSQQHRQQQHAQPAILQDSGNLWQEWKKNQSGGAGGGGAGGGGAGDGGGGLTSNVASGVLGRISASATGRPRSPSSSQRPKNAPVFQRVMNFGKK